VYRALVIDDDDAEAKTLVDGLERYARETGLALSVSRLSSAVEFDAQAHPADVIFMDIDMPGMDGMEAAGSLREVDDTTLLVFVTNLARYAAHGYAVDAMDFIVKPVRYEDLAMRMRRVTRALERTAKLTHAVSTRDGMRVIPLGDLLYVEVMHHDLYYHLAGGEEPLRVRGSLGAVEGDLGEDFVRISANTLVNMAHVAAVSGGQITLDSGDELWCSRSRKRPTAEAIAVYLGERA